ncbi:MAG: hypothetical protein J7578_25075, partial [Chitinophagaceae bacterium]|nr:hypothetical protein [Chitinophagaceae bacterium]
MRRSSVYIAAILSSMVCSNAMAQVKGDEDAEMFNRAKARDQQAIDEAKSGWWAESMKNHDQR